jgi:single-strand DNA-binding protein
VASFNKVILAGNLTRDPELTHTPKGTAVGKFSLAINRNWTTETGEKREEVTFVDVKAFGRQAETVAKFLRKGRPLLVEGRLHLETWDDKTTGAKRSRTVVVMESFSFIDSAERASSTPAPSAAAPAAPAPSTPIDDDDVPF